MDTERNSVVFYQVLGKLFYAIAAADKHVDPVEYHKLKELVKNEWLSFDDYEDDYKADAAYQIEIVFDWLYKNDKVQPNEWFQSFLDYKRMHEKLFNKKLNSLILKTAQAIANSFYGINKSELIMLAKLSIELKKNIDMKYYYSTIINGDFEDIEIKVITLLKNEGFGILTQIDMQQTLKTKLNVNFKKYKILGACNPPFAYKALQLENKIGTMLPCNIIIQELFENSIEVSAINPMISMQAVKNDQLKEIVKEVSAKLNNIIKSISNEE